MKFLFLSALLCTLVWIAAARPERERRETSRVSRAADKSFQEEFLKVHNDYRKKHKVPPLTLSEELNKYAQEWADGLAERGEFEHRPNNKYGENIYMSWSSDPNAAVSGKDAVNSWYDEVKVHTFGTEPNDLSSGHFTQVVWEDTKEVGVGLAKGKDGKIYVVANYNPPGNMMGSFAEKVHPSEL